MGVDRWANRSPGDLSVTLPEVVAGDVSAVVEQAHAAAPAWTRVPLAERIERMRAAQRALMAAKEELARGITIETGKPITEAHGEVAAVVAKIDLTIADAEAHLAERSNLDGPHAAWVRQCARGPAAVIGPFNFPLHLGHGANVAHLLAGNPVIYKPSPLAANVAAHCVALPLMHSSPPGLGVTISQRPPLHVASESQACTVAEPYSHARPCGPQAVPAVGSDARHEPPPPPAGASVPPSPPAALDELQPGMKKRSRRGEGIRTPSS